MRRAIGLILSAVVLGLAALFLLVFAALITYVALLARLATSGPMQPFVLYRIFTLGFINVALLVWAILTVIGILRLRAWARYSILIIGGGLAVLGFFGAVAAVFSQSSFPTVAVHSIPNARILSAVIAAKFVFYLLIAATGIWWLVYFNLRSTRNIFLQTTIPETAFQPIPHTYAPPTHETAY